MTREDFLKEFLGALGAIEIVFSESNDDSICGKVIYDPNGPDEYQEFCWRMTERDIPSKEVYNLAKLIKEQELLIIDRINKTRNELKDLYNKRWNVNLSLAGQVQNFV